MTQKTDQIHPLEDHVIDQIAAGEVIERPASVVKELLENALDAGAELIEVDFTRGGIDRIEVRDDGRGISPDDLPRAVERHATSKLRSTDDLESIHTLGFRGEALASITSVARVEIVSRHENEDEAYQLTMQPGGESEIKPAARKQGTTVTVEQLFVTVPARRKFLKTERTERKHLVREVQRKVLAHPDREIRLKEEGEVQFSVPPAPLLKRVEETMGGDIADDLIAVDRLESDWDHVGRIGLTGLIGKGEVAARSRRHQFYFINGRPVREPMLFRAVSRAYQDLVISDEHPPVFLFLDLPREEIDVNVHPRKEEVRIHPSQDVFRFVYRSLRDTIKEHFQQGARSAVSTEFGSGVPTPSEKQRAEKILGKRDQQPGQVPFHPDQAGGEDADDPELFSGEQGEAGQEPPPGPSSRVLGQFRETFLVVERDSGLFLVDQHTAHERILYEQYRKQVQGAEPAQHLSVPLTLDLDRTEADVILSESDELEKFGLTIESFGGGSLVVQTVPGYIGRRADDKRAIYGILEEFLEWSREDRLSDPGDNLITIMACRSAVMRGDRLMPREMEELMRGLEELDYPGKCPHGRNIFHEIGNPEIARWFQRPEDDVCAQ